MQLHIRHLTEFHYAYPLTGGTMKIKMTPWCGRGQELRQRELKLTGCMQSSSFRDFFGNSVELVVVDEGQDSIRVEMSADVVTLDRAGIWGNEPNDTPASVFQSATPRTIPGEAIGRIAQQFAGEDLRDPEILHRLAEHVRSNVAYRIGSTSAETTAEEAALKGEGVCQDHTHIFISAARMLGLSARYVSGYLKMHDRTEQEAMHAWAEVYIDNLGWTGFDVANGISPEETHVRIAVGRDYYDAAPITGIVRGGGTEKMMVTISVSS